MANCGGIRAFLSNDEFSIDVFAALTGTLDAETVAQIRRVVEERLGEDPEPAEQ